MLRTCMLLFFAATTIPSVVHAGGAQTGCSAHADCGSDEYCYDTGYFTTGKWNGVGSCSGYPPHCCGGADGDPIDRDVANCPAASSCENTTATASNCQNVCEGRGYLEAQCAAVSQSCAWINSTCWSGVGSTNCSYFPAQTSSRDTCSAHADCGSDEYCYDTGYVSTGQWNGVGYCSGFPAHCCANADADPIDRDVANCPATSRCESATAMASNCENVCEGHGYDAAQCVAVSQSCDWNNGACWSGVGATSCSYNKRSADTTFGTCSAHADCGSDEYCYDTGYVSTGQWNGVGYCSGFPAHCCANADADPIDRDVANCPATSRCESATAMASNCENVCEGHGYDAAQCVAVSQSCDWNNGACWSGVGATSCSYNKRSADTTFGTCSAHADCGSDEYCYDTGYVSTGQWNGVGYCSGFPAHCCANADADPIDRDVANCPATSRCESATAMASNCENVCEGHGYDAMQCIEVNPSCEWHNGACWSGVGSKPCDSGSATHKVFDALFALVTLCALTLM